MELHAILNSRVVRLIDISGADGGRIYGVNLSRSLETRYGFLQGPRSVEDFDPDSGITYLHGFFNRTVIDRLQIYRNGISVDAKADTTLCESFIEDIIDWGRSELDITLMEQPKQTRFFVSTLEVRSLMLFSNAFKKISDFGATLSDTLKSYGQTGLALQLSGLSYAFNPGQATIFKLEYREGSQPDDHLFFSTAPLRTSDHLSYLALFETMFADPGASVRRP